MGNMMMMMMTSLVLDYAVSLTDQLCNLMFVFVLRDFWLLAKQQHCLRHVQQVGMLQACNRVTALTVLHLAPAF
jgi:hypothetical protein